MNKKILIIDNDEDFLKSIQETLQSSGYDTAILSDPFKAEECIEKENPDLLILDIVMFGRSGFDILDDLDRKKIYKKIPKILLTALDDSIVTSMCGVREYISKPFDPDQLISRIKKCLGETEQEAKWLKKS